MNVESLCRYFCVKRKRYKRVDLSCFDSFCLSYPHRYRGLESWMLAGRLMQHEYSARRDVLDFSKGGIEM